LSNDLTKQEKAFEHQILDWTSNTTVSDLKQQFGSGLTDSEFSMFMMLSKNTGLNPFLKEVWAVKYDKNVPAQIFISRDGYRRVIGQNPSYRGHCSDAVYSNDEFHCDIQTGAIHHKMNFKDRGRLIGAYSKVLMENADIPYYVFVNIEEYDKNNSIWKEKKATMIKKVAECQAIRMAAYNQLAGTYSPDEVPDDMLKAKAPPKSISVNEMLGLSSQASGMQVNFEVKQPVTLENVPDERMFSFDDVRALMAEAETREELLDAAALVPSLNFSEEEKDRLKELYSKRKSIVEQKI
jgi:phage recombination protein Bet